MKKTTIDQYPLGERAIEHIRAASRKALTEITLEALKDGALKTSDLQVSAETLRAQADIARQAGYIQLADNLLRAAELTAVPNDELLRLYEALRPGRSTQDELIALAKRLEETYGAFETGRLVREAAVVYLQRGLLRAQRTNGR
ncbi:MAG: diol dehydratase small subunit [Anaerolineae bacterium]|nr:diol dehydratase small subunit [Thermoflexales bacterium]MDW8406680.1 diol dehydratase small subunit [Anaerolineae bacterium]